MASKDNAALTDEELNEVYGWVDCYQFSRPKKNMARDFSDGLLVAELVKSHHDKLVDLHNYPSSHNVKQKMTNWNTLNSRRRSAGKIFSKFGLQVKLDQIEKIVNCEPEAIERCLLALKRNMEETKNKPKPPPDKKYPDYSGGSYGLYTNVVSPVETPGLMVNQHFPIMVPPQAHLQPRYPGAPVSMIPPETPVSKIPVAEVDPNQRRRSPVMQRAGLNMMDGMAPKQSPAPGGKVPNGKGKPPVDYEGQYQGLNPKQLINVIRDKDSKITDLVETVEVA